MSDALDPPEPGPMAEEMRLQKLLSRAGIASRRAAETLIAAGRVRVNGHVVQELGAKVDPERDEVSVDGRPVRLPRPVWLALHKPVGYVSTRSDPQGRPTIYDLLPEKYRGLFYVGRLDLNSEGLVLLTNEGEIANRMMHPRWGVEREYDVVVRGEVGDEAISRLMEGVALEDGIARAARVELRRPPRAGTSRLVVTLKEGRKREVRRMFDAVGHRVLRLVRVRYGPVKLGDLESGAWRRLGKEEVDALSAIGGRRR